LNAVDAITGDLRTLARVRFQRIRGLVRSSGRAGVVRGVLIVVGAVFFTGGLYVGANRFLYWIISRTDYVGSLLTGVFLDFLMLIALAILVLSSLVSALAVVLLSDDLMLLRAAPVRSESLFLERTLVVWLQTAWMPVTFVAPILFGFHAAWARFVLEFPGNGSGPDTLGLLWLMAAGLPALTLVPAALASLLALLFGRFVSAARLRNALIALFIIAGLGLYATGQYLRIDNLLNPEGLDDFLTNVEQIEPGGSTWLPSQWLADGMGVALHGGLAAQSLREDKAFTDQTRERLLERAAGAIEAAMGREQSWLRPAIDGLVYDRDRMGALGAPLDALKKGIPFFAMRKPPPKTPWWPPFALLGIGLLITAVGAAVSRTSYRLAHGRAQSSRQQAAGVRRGPWKGLVALAAGLLPQRFSVFARKDLLIFLRDPAQWSQLLILVGVLAVSGWGFRAAADQASLAELAKVLPYASVVLFGVGSWVGTLITAAACARLVFPMVSLEGQGFWLVRVAPVSMRRFLAAKLSVVMLPTIALGCAITAVVCSTLSFPEHLTQLAVAMAAVNAIVAVCLGVGLGAALPDFNYVNLSRLVQGPGGILFIILSMAYATVLTGSASAFVWFLERGSMPVADAGLRFLVPPIALGILIAGLALRIGVRRLERLRK
jgi:hypothetical protein